MSDRKAPGEVRDAIVTYLVRAGTEAKVSDICEGVALELGENIPPSSVRSYLRLNTPEKFERISRGRYRIKESSK